MVWAIVAQLHFGALPLLSMTSKKRTNKPERAIKHLVHQNNGIHHIKLPHHTIGYILRGSLCVYDAECNHIHEGEMYILVAGWHTVEYFSTHLPYEEITATVDDHLAHTIFCDLEPTFDIATNTPGDTPLSCAHNPCDAMLKAYYKSIRKYLCQHTFDLFGAMEPLKIKELIYLVLSTPHTPVAIGLQHTMALNNLSFQDYVQSSIFKHHTIAQLAHKCNMSTSNFKQTFKCHYGCSPHQWFVAQRMTAVGIALRCTNEPIKNIALDCGFASPSHMIRLFRAKYGVTPSQYRNLNTPIHDELSTKHQTHPQQLTQL